MKIILKDVKFPPHINLGFQTDFDKQDMTDRNYKIRAWAPKNAKSFKIISESEYYPYGPNTLNGSIEVAYFTKESEGTKFSELPADKWGRNCVAILTK